MWGCRLDTDTYQLEVDNTRHWHTTYCILLYIHGNYRKTKCWPFSDPKWKKLIENALVSFWEFVLFGAKLNHRSPLVSFTGILMFSLRWGKSWTKVRCLLSLFSRNKSNAFAIKHIKKWSKGIQTNRWRWIGFGSCAGIKKNWTRKRLGEFWKCIKVLNRYFCEFFSSFCAFYCYSVKRNSLEYSILLTIACD